MLPKEKRLRVFVRGADSPKPRTTNDTSAVRIRPLPWKHWGTLVHGKPGGHRLPRTMAIQKLPRHWSTCRDDLVCGAAKNREGQDAVNACECRVL